MKRYKVKVQKIIILETEIEVLEKNISDVKKLDFSKNDFNNEVNSKIKIVSIDKIDKPITETGKRLVKVINGTKTIPTGSVLEVVSIYSHGGGIWKITFKGKKAHLGLDRVRHLDGSKVIKKEFWYGLTLEPKSPGDVGRLVIPTSDNTRKGVEQKPYEFVDMLNGSLIIVKDNGVEKRFKCFYDWCLYDDGNLTPEDYYTEQNFELYTDNQGMRKKKLNVLSDK